MKEKSIIQVRIFTCNVSRRKDDRKGPDVDGQKSRGESRRDDFDGREHERSVNEPETAIEREEPLFRVVADNPVEKKENSRQHNHQQTPQEEYRRRKGRQKPPC